MLVAEYKALNNKMWQWQILYDWWEVPVKPPYLQTDSAVVLYTQTQDWWVCSFQDSPDNAATTTQKETEKHLFPTDSEF